MYKYCNLVIVVYLYYFISYIFNMSNFVINIKIVKKSKEFNYLIYMYLKRLNFVYFLKFEKR